MSILVIERLITKTAIFQQALKYDRSLASFNFILSEIAEFYLFFAFRLINFLRTGDTKNQ